MTIKIFSTGAGIFFDDNRAGFERESFTNEIKIFSTVSNAKLPPFFVAEIPVTRNLPAEKFFSTMREIFSRHGDCVRCAKKFQRHVADAKIFYDVRTVITHFAFRITNCF